MDDREYELKKSELALREREVSAREKEAAVQEKESNTSKLNPLTLAIIGAALGLFGNMFTSYFNNKASDEAEHLRAQSNLVLSVIKTNGNDADACKNLNFFVNIGWLDDPKGAIHNVCGVKGGVPTLPAAGGLVEWPNTYTSLNSRILTNVSIRVEDADSHKPIQGAKVEVNAGTLAFGLEPISSITNAEGVVGFGFASTSDTVTISKDGYQTTSEKMGQMPEANLSQKGQFTILSTLYTVSLHKISKPK